MKKKPLRAAADVRSRRTNALHRPAPATPPAGLACAPAGYTQVTRVEPAVAAGITVPNNGHPARTTAYAGARYVEYESNVFSDFSEAAASVGLHHRFQ